MTDRELLELAAKAAGIDANLEYDGTFSLWKDVECIQSVWNPLTDDGDALRLAVKLNMAIQPCTLVDPPFLPSVECGQYSGDDPNPPEWAEEALGSDPYAATRRAIVRAAAEIGKGMK